MKIPSAYFTYIVECTDSTFYVGVTNNIVKRVRQHNGEITGGAKYTRQRKPVILRYTEKYETYIIAARRERELKKLTHQQKEKLCKSVSIETFSPVIIN